MHGLGTAEIEKYSGYSQRMVKSMAASSTASSTRGISTQDAEDICGEMWLRAFSSPLYGQHLERIASIRKTGFLQIDGDAEKGRPPLRFEDVPSFRAWSMQALVRQYTQWAWLDWTRKCVRHSEFLRKSGETCLRETISSFPNPEDAAIADSEAARIPEAIVRIYAGLSPFDRSVMDTVFDAGMSQREARAALGCHMNTLNDSVKSIVRLFMEEDIELPSSVLVDSRHSFTDPYIRGGGRD